MKDIKGNATKAEEKEGKSWDFKGQIIEEQLHRVLGEKPQKKNRVKMNDCKTILKP